MLTGSSGSRDLTWQPVGFASEQQSRAGNVRLGTLWCQYAAFALGFPVSLKKLLIFYLQFGFQVVQGGREEVGVHPTTLHAFSEPVSMFSESHLTLPSATGVLEYQPLRIINLPSLLRQAGSLFFPGLLWILVSNSSESLKSVTCPPFAVHLPKVDRNLSSIDLLFQSLCSCEFMRFDGGSSHILVES